MWNRVSTSLTNPLRSPVGNEPLLFAAARTTSTIAALAADLTTIAAPSVCICVVAGVDALALGPLGMALALDLDSLLLDGGAVANAPAGNDGPGFFHPLGCRLVRLTGLDR